MKTETGTISNIRRLDVNRDLLSVADLIEMCFSTHLDEDGRRYINQIRKSARNRRYLYWIRAASERVSVPLFGYVWEEDGKVVGNLSLVPYSREGKWVYLIANVVVHPEYRRHGIARQLTLRALEHVRQRKAAAVWLHVREGNMVAINLYRSLGFYERTRRTQWMAKRLNAPPASLPLHITVAGRRRQCWEWHRTWLCKAYPTSVAWYLSFDSKRFKPSIQEGLKRIIIGGTMRHWVAYDSGELIGVVTWETSRRSADPLWLATMPEREDQVIRTLLPHACWHSGNRRKFIINYPAGRGKEAFKAVNFSVHNTLVWMEMSLGEKNQGDGTSVSIDKRT